MAVEGPERTVGELQLVRRLRWWRRQQKGCWDHVQQLSGHATVNKPGLVRQQRCALEADVWSWGWQGSCPGCADSRKGAGVIGQQKMSGQAAGAKLGSAGQLMAGQVCQEAAVQL
jgi:hypothetical protein